MAVTVAQSGNNMKIPAALVCLLVTLLALAACSRNPNIRKSNYLRSGDAYLKAGKYSAAAIEYRKALQIDPRFAAAHYQLAKAELNQKNWADAYRELQTTLDLQPDNTGAALDLGNLLLAGKDPEHAQAIASTLLQKHSHNADAHALMANVEQSQGRSEQALQEIGAAIELQPRRARFYLARGLFVMAGSLDAAERDFKKATALDPKLAAAFGALSQLYAREQLWPLAEQAAQKDIALEPASVPARLALARLYLAQQNQAAAETVLSQAARDLPADPQACRLLPEFYQASGEPQKALAAFANVYDRHPGDSTTSFEYAQLLLDLNQVAQARQVNAAALQRDPKQTGARIIQGEILIRIGQTSDAVTLLQDAINDDPNNAFAHFQLGNALRQNGDVRHAELEWRRAARLQPNLLPAQRALARLAINRHDLELLSQVAQQLIAHAPDSPEGYIDRALVESNSRQFHKVEADLSRALQIAPHSALPLVKMADWRAAQKRYAEADAFYEKALALDPNSGEALRGLVLLYAAQSQPQKGLARVQAQIAKSPGNSDFYLLLGRLQMQKGDLSAAEASLQTAVNLNHGNTDAYYRLGKVQDLQGAYSRALATSYQWMKDDPQDQRAYVLAGSLEERKGNWRVAQDLYRRALGLRSDDPAASNNLAYSLLQNGGNPDVALSLAQTAYRAAPKTAGFADTLGWAYFHKGLYQLAMPLLRQALQNAPDNALYHYHVGMLYARVHDPRARSQLLAALKTGPDSATAASIRQELHSLPGYQN